MKTAIIFAALVGLASVASAAAIPKPNWDAEALAVGSKQVPPLNVTMYAKLKLVVAKDLKKINWELAVADAVNLTMAHIHLGSAAVNGPPVVPILPAGVPFPDNGTLPMMKPAYTGKLHLWKGSFNSSDIIAPIEGFSIEDMVALFHTETTYVNLHTTEYPAGAIRGQIHLI